MVVDLNTKILVVDDYPTMVHIIRNQLSQLNFTNVDHALDGESALRKLREEKFGLVLSDWNMKPMNGLELLKAIRADAKFKDLPFIMVTAEKKTEKIIMAKEAGVSNYIIKPFNLVTLEVKLSTVLGDF